MRHILYINVFAIMSIMKNDSVTGGVSICNLSWSCISVKSPVAMQMMIKKEDV